LTRRGACRTCRHRERDVGDEAFGSEKVGIVRKSPTPCLWDGAASHEEMEMAEKRRESTAPLSLFGEFDPFREFFRTPAGLPPLFRERPAAPGGEEGSLLNWAPPMDIVENAEGYEISLELPGTKKEDVTVECHENLLTVKGEKRSEREETQGHQHYAERTFGSFSRTIRLPADASDQVKASVKDGVLTIRISKAEERKPRVVSIES
jgi:HSP20 family protein